jgi:Na+(H+)/acetate symporter ActP
MKELLKKTFDTNVLAVVGVVFGLILTFEFIVFPGLTAADTILNLLSALIGIFSILFAFHFIQWKKLFNFLSEEEIKPGETELDYIPKKEIIKKKRNPKQFNGVKSDEPFVKTRTKPKTEKVMGEYQLNNKEKVRKSLTENKK